MGRSSRGNRGPNNPDRDRRYQSAIDRIWHRFGRDELARVCEMHETAFPSVYGLDVVEDLDQRAPNDWYAFRDNGSNILAVAHLDTVADAAARRANFVNTEDGWVVYSRALDDRLGAYTILELLPKLGLHFDILLTVGEEQGQSTAAFFTPDKKYDWIIEFDRGGTDVVLYQYEDPDTVALVKASGARVGDGSYSDISYMSHVGAKGMNWGVGYRDYHGPRAHAFLDDYVSMIAYFLEFHATNKDVTLPHDEQDEWWGGYGMRGGRGTTTTVVTAGGGYPLTDGRLDRRWLDDDADDDAEFNQWLKEHAQYSPDATCPGVTAHEGIVHEDGTPWLVNADGEVVSQPVEDRRDPVGDLIDDRLAAIRAETTQLALPGVDDVPAEVKGDLITRIVTRVLPR